jgi:hypothetical protein
MTSGAADRDDVLEEPVTEWRRHEIRRIKAAVPGAIGIACFVVGLILAAAGSPRRALVFGLIGLVELGLAAGFSMWTNRAQVVLTSSEVMSRVGRRDERVPLSEVRAVIVGGSYRRGWSTWLLLDEGRSVRLSAPTYVFANRMKVYGATGASYWRAVAESPSGRQAVLIHAASGLEGSVAPLMRDHPVRSQVTRWWSPTGEGST